VYTGAIGYLGFGGRADLNIAIRTILFDAGRVTFQVGGGIVADSEPEREFEETIHKASGIMKALNIAQNLEGLKNGSQG
jgi:anthranilate/para-aminobenzoate synthase component I